jgi:hypothetical protein
MFEKVFRVLKPIVKTIIIYSIIVLSVIASFLVGRYYQSLRIEPDKREITKVLKQDVILAVDEYNNLILIQKSTGDYTVFQDSIGKNIFNIYANRILTQNGITF